MEGVPFGRGRGCGDDLPWRSREPRDSHSQSPGVDTPTVSSGDRVPVARFRGSPRSRVHYSRSSADRPSTVSSGRCPSPHVCPLSSGPWSGLSGDTRGTSHLPEVSLPVSLPRIGGWRVGVGVSRPIKTSMPYCPLFLSSDPSPPLLTIPTSSLLTDLLHPKTT